jgi:hypothetical protein
MTTMRAARAHALSLPEATEADHHGMGSFRVRGRIFSTVPDAAHLRVMVGEDEVLAALADDPGSCAPLHWGTRLAGVTVTLRSARLALVKDLLTEAYLRKAPPSLARQVAPPR